MERRKELAEIAEVAARADINSQTRGGRSAIKNQMNEDDVSNDVDMSNVGSDWGEEDITRVHEMSD